MWNISCIKAGTEQNWEAEFQGGTVYPSITFSALKNVKSILEEI